jgi:hypothetical protein
MNRAAATQELTAAAMMVCSSEVPTEAPGCWPTDTVAEATPAPCGGTPGCRYLHPRDLQAHADSGQDRWANHTHGIGRVRVYDDNVRPKRARLQEAAFPVARVPASGRARSFGRTATIAISTPPPVPRCADRASVDRRKVLLALRRRLPRCPTVRLA